MSLKAIIWVMEEAPVENHGELAVLYALADRADDNGHAAWPSQEWLSYRARCTDRTVRNHLSNLEDRGVIERGDYRLVEHFPRNRRPIVWNLNMSLTRPEKWRPENISGRKILTPRPENPDTLTGKSEQLDRKGVSDKPSLNPPRTIQEPRGARKEKTQPSERGTRLPENWQPPIETNNNLGEKYPHVDLDEELEIFRDYWAAKTGKDAVKRDWVATWRNWVRRTSKWGSAQSGKTTQAENEEIWSIEI